MALSVRQSNTRVNRRKGRKSVFDSALDSFAQSPSP